MKFAISSDFIAGENHKWEAALDEDYSALQRQLRRRGIDIEAITAKAMNFAVAVPSWGVGTGGTRFARFPGPGEPRDIFDKLEDCAVIHRLSRITPAVSLHFPWDKVSDYAALKDAAASHDLTFDAVNLTRTKQQEYYRFDNVGDKDRYNLGTVLIPRTFAVGVRYSFN